MERVPYVWKKMWMIYGMKCHKRHATCIECIECIECYGKLKDIDEPCPYCREKI